jgi:hypothetical protein
VLKKFRLCEFDLSIANVRGEVWGSKEAIGRHSLTAKAGHCSRVPRARGSRARDGEDGPAVGRDMLFFRGLGPNEIGHAAYLLLTSIGVARGGRC